MVIKKDIIEGMLYHRKEHKTIFIADGHQVVILRENDTPSSITIDGEESTPQDLFQYDHFVFPSCTILDAGEMDFTEDYDISPSIYNRGVLNAKNVGQIVTLFGEATKITPPQPVIKVGVFECKSCMRVHEVLQRTEELHPPKICTECGGRSFKLLPEESGYTEKQIVTLTVDHFPYPIPVILTGKRCSYTNFKENHYYYFRGVLAVEGTGKQNTYYLKYAEDVTDIIKR